MHHGQGLFDRWGSNCRSFGGHRTILTPSRRFCRTRIYLLRHQVTPRPTVPPPRLFTNFLAPWNI